MLLVAVQSQPLAAVTLAVAVPPAGGWVAVSGATLKLHVAPLWVTVTVCPATVNVPVRPVVEALDATEYVTVPLPVPLAPAVTVIQAMLLVAVQLQPLAAVTLAVAVPPAADSPCVSGAIVGLHCGENENVLDNALRLTPPGPTAATSAS
jgi:hypothetical protein